MNVMYSPFFGGKNLPRARRLPAPPCSKDVAAPIQLIVVGGDVVVPRQGRLVSPLIVEQAWEVLPAQKTQDVVDLAFVSTATEDSPTPATID